MKNENLVRQALLDILLQILLLTRKSNSHLHTSNVIPALADHAHNIPIWLQHENLNIDNLKNYYESERVYCIEKFTETGYKRELWRFEND